MVSALLLAVLSLPSPGDHRRSLVVDGIERHYIVHLPRPARRGPLPVVILLHGAGGTGRRVAASTGFSAEADRRGFVAVYPDGVGGKWHDGRGPDAVDDVAFVRSMLDSVASELAVDTARIYAAGISNGAMFAHRLGCELPGRFAAIAAVAGGMPVATAARCASGAPLSFIAFNGTADRLVPFEGGSSLEAARASAAHWAAADACEAAPVPSLERDRAPTDGTRVRRWTWTGCATGTAVTLYEVQGGGHSWPGGYQPRIPILGRTTRDLSATRTIAAFFMAHPRAK